MKDHVTTNSLQEAALLGHVCTLIWGDQWRTRLSIFLAVRRDTIQDWLQGRNSIPRFVWPRLFAELERQVEKIAAARADMKSAGLLKGRG
jgi:hypothetical protein